MLRAGGGRHSSMGANQKEELTWLEKSETVSQEVMVELVIKSWVTKERHWNLKQPCKLTGYIYRNRVPRHELPLHHWLHRKKLRPSEWNKVTLRGSSSPGVNKHTPRLQTAFSLTFHTSSYLLWVIWHQPLFSVQARGTWPQWSGTYSNSFLVFPQMKITA